MENRERKLKFLDHFIFYGLKDRNTGYDSSTIKHFSKEDFEKVLDRVEFFKIKIYGIETFSNGKFWEVETYEDYRKKPNNPKWYRAAFKKMQKSGKMCVFTASYDVSEKLLDLFIGKSKT